MGLTVVDWVDLNSTEFAEDSVQSRVLVMTFEEVQFSQSIKQSVSQSFGNSVCQLANHSVCQSVGRLVVSRSVSQPVGQSVRQSFSQPVTSVSAAIMN
jgi:hypothetical protein